MQSVAEASVCSSWVNRFISKPEPGLCLDALIAIEHKQRRSACLDFPAEECRQTFQPLLISSRAW